MIQAEGTDKIVKITLVCSNINEKKIDWKASDQILRVAKMKILAFGQNTFYFFGETNEYVGQWQARHCFKGGSGKSHLNICVQGKI